MRERALKAILILWLATYMGYAQPTGQPSGQPTAQPTRQPIRQPSGQPSTQPTLGLPKPLAQIVAVTPNYAAFIPDALASTDATILKAKIAIAMALGAFSCALLFSWRLDDVKTARRTLVLLRFYILVEYALQAILLYYLLALGSPLPVTTAIVLLPDGKTDWLFSFWRPLTSLLLIGAGTMASTTPAPKLICLLGCAWNLTQTLVSMVQIDDYETQVMQFQAPRGNYSRNDLIFLYWRDIVSLGVSFAILFSVLHIAALQGVFTVYEAPFLTYSQIRGAETDRAATMRKHRTDRIKTELAMDRVDKKFRKKEN